MKRFALFFIVLISVFSLSAEAFLSVNDLEPAKIVERVEFDGVFVVGEDGKHVTIEEASEKEAPDGEVFNLRMKLEGSGSAKYRHIELAATKGETLKVYLISSGSDVRNLAIVNKDTGAEVGVLNAPSKDDPMGIATFAIPADGTYLLYSKNKGINIYMVVCE